MSFIAGNGLNHRDFNWLIFATTAVGPVVPTIPFTITFDEVGAVAGNLVGNFYYSEFLVTALPGILFQNEAGVFPSSTPSEPGPVGVGGQFSWIRDVTGPTNIGFQLDAALGARKAQWQFWRGSGWTSLTVKTSLGIEENFVVDGSPTAFGWDLFVVDLDVLKVTRPSLAGGFLTEFYLTSGAFGGVYALDGLNIS